MAKLAPAKFERALNVAAVVASSIADRGTVPSDKMLRQCCLTGLRIVTMMDTLAAAVDEEPAILELSLDNWDAYRKFEEVAATISKRQAEAAAAAAAAEAAAAEKAAAEKAAAEKGKA
jgi:hypothetical protein